MRAYDRLNEDEQFFLHRSLSELVSVHPTELRFVSEDVHGGKCFSLSTEHDGMVVAVLVVCHGTQKLGAK